MIIEDEYSTPTLTDWKDIYSSLKMEELRYSCLPPKISIKGRETIKLNKSRFMRITNLAKKLLDADTRTLIKTGYLNRDLEITEDGQDALLSILFTEKKAELVKMAQEEIEEHKE